MLNPSVVRALARSILAGEPDAHEVAARAAHTLGRNWRWLRPLARRFVEAFSSGTRPRRRDVIEFLIHDIPFQQACRKYSHEISVAHWLAEPQHMLPVGAAETWGVPRIESVGELAHWLEVEPAELDWFADLKGLGYKRTAPKLRHYHYRVLEKRFGRIRLIEAPKSRLKELQRRILSGILERIPAHAAVHGFLKGRSIKTFIAPHVAQQVILKLDLEDFFPSISGPRVQALFRTMGYPELVADLQGGICTNATPRDVWNGIDGDPAEIWKARDLYARPHLPQGAPTSPALANLCAYRADCRLAGLARSAGAAYTRYADDPAFSGGEEFGRAVERFSIHAAAILLEEGFQVHHRKTRIMRQGVRQRLVGLVANERMNVQRTDFDRLKATLTNCVRHGPDSQNREGHAHFRAHLEGRVAFVESISPEKARRLRAISDQIQWG